MDILLSVFIGSLLGAAIITLINRSSNDEAWRDGFEAGEKYIKEHGEHGKNNL